MTYGFKPAYYLVVALFAQRVRIDWNIKPWVPAAAAFKNNNASLFVVSAFVWFVYVSQALADCLASLYKEKVKETFIYFGDGVHTSREINRSLAHRPFMKTVLFDTTNYPVYLKNLLSFNKLKT